MNMNGCKLIFTALLLACLPIAAWAAAGKVAAMGGQVTVAHASAPAVALHKGDAVNKGDTIATAADSWVILSMEDGASLTLRPKARLRIDDYVYDPDHPQNGRSWLTLLQGALRSVTGAIGKLNRASDQLTTPTATIGIRGTDYEVDVVPEGDSTGFAPGTYHTVHAGGTILKSKGSKPVNVKPRQNMFAGNAAPRHVPASQRSIWTDIGSFDAKAKIADVLDDLHLRTQGGYTLDPDKLSRGGDQVRRYERQGRRRKQPVAQESLPEPPNSSPPAVEERRSGLMEMAGRKAAPEAATQSRLQHGESHSGAPYFKPGTAGNSTAKTHPADPRQQDKVSAKAGQRADSKVDTGAGKTEKQDKR